MTNVSSFLTPGVSGNTLSEALSLPGDAAQQAFGAEYNAVGIKNASVLAFTDQSAGNSVGVLDPVGSSSGTGGTTVGPVSPSGNVAQGQNGYNTGTGWWLGTDQGVPKFSIGNGTTNYLTWDGTTLSVKGSVNVSSINIPDTTTASSFHVDTSGNTWWGANVATGYTGANAYILATGLASFKNILVGGSTYQYQINNNGSFSFGDGSDGSATISVNTTLTSDKYYTDLTINSGVTLNPGGYRIFCSGTLTVNGKIARNGNNGNSGTGAPTGTKGTGGAALADGYLKGAVAGSDGGNGVGNAGGQNGTVGANTSNSIGVNGVTGGAGGTGSVGAPGTGGTGGTATQSNVKLIANWHLQTLLDISSSGSTVKFDNSAAAGGGGAGGGGGGGAGGGGGGGGSAGGIVAVYARTIVIGASGQINAIGGTGGTGGDNGGAASGQAAGGGGGGGAGGNIILVYNTITNGGSMSVAGGTGGTAGNCSVGGGCGINGTSGNSGIIRQFMISL